MPCSEPVAQIRLEAVSKYFAEANGEKFFALENTSISIAKGEQISIVGRSGSGKSTLMSILCALAAPSGGTYHFDGKPAFSNNINSKNSVSLRRRFGYISQGSDMINNLSVLENVKLAAVCRNLDKTDSQAESWLAKVGLHGHGSKYPSELSGGERQRANIARSLVCEPEVLFADEPTGSLDVATSEEIINLIIGLGQEVGTTTVMVTHSPEFAARCTRSLFLSEGKVVLDEENLTEEKITKFIRELIC